MSNEIHPVITRLQYVSYDLYEGETWISGSTVILSLPKFFNYKDPGLQVSAHGDEIIVKTHAYAKSIEIANANEDLILEDNYFDMNEGERRIKVIKGDTSNLQIRSVYDIR